MTREELEEMLAKMFQPSGAQGEENESEKSKTEEEKTDPNTGDEKPDTTITELLKKFDERLKEVEAEKTRVVEENKNLITVLNELFKQSPAPEKQTEKPKTSDTEITLNDFTTKFIERENSVVNRYLKEFGIEKENK